MEENGLNIKGRKQAQIMSGTVEGIERMDTNTSIDLM